MSPPLFLHTSRGKGRRILADGKDDFFVGKGRKEGRKEKEEGNIDFVTSACSREGVFHVGVFHLVRRRRGGEAPV